MVRLGAWVEGMDADPSVLDRYAEQLGVPMDIAGIFRGPDDDWPYPGDVELGEGRTLLVSWHLDEKADLAGWAAGDQDGWLREAAARIQGHGGPVVLRPWAEMNGDWVGFQPTPRGAAPRPRGGTYEEFIGAWRHVVETVRSCGVTNVKWAFNPTADTYPQTTPVEALYPGDEHVDLLALDGYNWGEGRGLTWRSFTDIFAEQYARLTVLAPDLPVWIAETGCAEDPGHDKGAWWRQALRALGDDFPAVEALVLFDADKERDWRADSSPGALAGLREGLSAVAGG